MLYCCDELYDTNKPDEIFSDEYKAAKSLGVMCSLLQYGELEFKKFIARPKISGEVIYRGWMLDEAEYNLLYKLSSNSLINTPEQYLNCHHLPNWYYLVKEFTAETVICDVADIESGLTGFNFNKFFIKDYVKSLTTSRGSVATNITEIHDVINAMIKVRNIEGGICIRKFEDYILDTEERYFVFKSNVFSRNNIIPEMVNMIASRIDSQFFSIDVITDIKGDLRLVEIGDGQVSDLKKWTPTQFVKIFN